MDWCIDVCVIIVEENEAIHLRGSEVEYIGRIKVREHGRDWREEKEGGEI